MSDLRSELHRIYRAAGELTPRGLVTAATPKTHPLHSRFEWDDKKAGPLYRIVQARELIRSVQIEYGPASEQVNEFVSVKRPEGTTYIPVAEAAADPFTSELVLRVAEREWKALQRRYGHLSEFVALVRDSVA